jgi:hypothetical protein
MARQAMRQADEGSRTTLKPPLEFGPIAMVVQWAKRAQNHLGGWPTDTLLVTKCVLFSKNTEITYTFNESVGASLPGWFVLTSI